MESFTTTEVLKVFKPQKTPIQIYFLILLAGLIDVLTTYTGIMYFGLTELNLINSVMFFPVGVAIWVTYFIVFSWAISNVSYKVKTDREITEINRMVKYVPMFLATLSFVIPIHNLTLIMGGGFI